MKRRYSMVLALLPFVGLWGCGADTTTSPDTTPPLAPRLEGATLANGLVGVWWQANSEPDLAGYYVYVVENGVTRLAVTQPVILNFVTVAVIGTATVEVYVTAIDNSDNESSPSDTKRASEAAVVDPNRQILGGSPKDF